MQCPWCAVEHSPRELHAHLAGEHPDAVAFTESGGRSFYGITCPVCGDGYTHEIKPRGREPGFVAEFRAQIALVAFDMLVNHLLVEHDPDAPVRPAEDPAAAVPTPPPGSGPAWLTEARRNANRPNEEMT
jgi:hypothetical protein